MFQLVFERQVHPHPRRGSLFCGKFRNVHRVLPIDADEVKKAESFVTVPWVPDHRIYENAAECPAPVGGNECSDFKNPIGRTFLSGNRIFAETGKSRLSVKPRPYGRGASVNP
jgi:hypothetical protein